MKKAEKRDRLSYYVGWGLAYGTFAGGVWGVLFPGHLLAALYGGIALGAVMGALYGKWKLTKQSK